MPTRSIENFKNQIKPCLCKKNDANAVVFPAIFTAKAAQDSLVLQKHIVFVFATVAKDITNLSPHGKYLCIWRRGTCFWTFFAIKCSWILRNYHGKIMQNQGEKCVHVFLWTWQFSKCTFYDVTKPNLSRALVLHRRSSLHEISPSGMS